MHINAHQSRKARTSCARRSDGGSSAGCAAGPRDGGPDRGERGAPCPAGQVHSLPARPSFARTAPASDGPRFACSACLPRRGHPPTSSLTLALPILSLHPALAAHPQALADASSTWTQRWKGGRACLPMQASGAHSCLLPNHACTELLRRPEHRDMGGNSS